MIINKYFVAKKISFFKIALKQAFKIRLRNNNTFFNNHKKLKLQLKIINLPYLKFLADQLFNGYRMLGNEMVLITNEKGKIIDIINKQEGGEDVQYIKGILCPGFINAHCHLELSHLKAAIPEKTGLVDFVFNVVTQRNRFNEEQIAMAIAKAEDDMLLNGIVAVGDICNNTSTIPQKEKNRLAYYNFIEVSGWLPEIAQHRFEKSKTHFEAFQKIENSTIKNAFAAHAPYSVSNNLWNLLANQFNTKTTTIHNQETSFEDDLFFNKTGDFNRMYEMMQIDNAFFTPSGKSSVQSYASYLEQAKNVLLVHNTFIKELDIKFLQNQIPQFFYCLCVRANTFIENTLPPIDLLRKNNCNIVLGTDSLASNYSLSILEEMKVIQQNFPSVTLTEMLQWATSNGSKALQFDDELGSFEKNKCPGLLVMEHVEDEKLSASTTLKRLL